MLYNFLSYRRYGILLSVIKLLLCTLQIFGWKIGYKYQRVAILKRRDRYKEIGGPGLEGKNIIFIYTISDDCPIFLLFKMGSMTLQSLLFFILWPKTWRLSYSLLDSKFLVSLIFLLLSSYLKITTWGKLIVFRESVQGN